MANQKKKREVKKFNLQEADDLWGDVLSDEPPDSDDDLFLDDLLYDDNYSDDAVGDEQEYDTYDEQYEDDGLLYDDTSYDDALGDEQFEDDYIPHDDSIPDEEHEQIPEEAAVESLETDVCSAMLEHLGGIRQEVACAKLFKPEENTLLIIDEETKDEQVVFFDQLSCIRVSGLPAGISGKRRESTNKEIIETVDGNIYHELVHTEQDLNNLLLCFSADDQSPFAFTLFPISNIKKRTLDARVIDILLKKRFISKSMLQRTLHEFEQVKSMTLEKIIAQKSRIPLAEIEKALDDAQQGPMQGMQKEEILLFSGLVTEQHILDAVESLEKIQKIRISQFLVQKGVVKEKEVYISLAAKYKIPFVDLIGRKFSKKYLALLPKSMILKHEILPIVLKDDILLVAAHYVDMTHLTAEIVKSAGCKHVKYVLSPPGQLRKIINMLLGKKK